MSMVDRDLKIEIRPIPGRNGIKSFSENLEYFSQAHILAPFVNPVTLKYVTGLTKEDVEALKESNFPYNLDDTYRKGVPHEFWESQTVKVELSSSPIFLYPGKNQIDFIKHKYLLQNNYIYNSEEEMLSGSKPEATHYIYNEGAANKIKASKLEKRNTQIQKVSDLSLTRKRQLILILLNENTDNKNEDYLIVRFEDIIKNKELSLELDQLLNKSSEDVSLSAEIKSAIQKNVLKRTKNGIFYFETNLGFTEADVASTLSSPENQEVLLHIKSKI
jgi:hypothetical protein